MCCVKKRKHRVWTVQERNAVEVQRLLFKRRDDGGA